MVTYDALRKAPAGCLLLCRICGAENSADYRDYFHVAPDHVFRCCSKPMLLRQKRTVYCPVDST